MAQEDLVAVDFETDGIEARPEYPPTPRGVAVLADGKATYERKFKRARDVWHRPMVFHNAAFDVAVATEKLAWPMPQWENCHDTQFLAFLIDPYSESLSLKKLAERYLGMPAVEQTDVKEWVMANVPEAKRKTVNWGYWIASAPMELLKPYAIGDVDRTLKLFHHLRAQLPERSVPAYDRERRLQPMLLENSRLGVRVDREELARDLDRFEHAMSLTNKRLWKLLGKTFNIDSGEELADALEESGLGSGFKATPSGKRSVSKDSLAQCEMDPKVRELLDYRGRLDTALTTFMRPWLRMSERSGRVHFEWNQVRADRGGARTGRLSSSPNCQNIPKEMKAQAPRGLPELPHLRTYLLPDEGEVWVRKDYSQQELRVLAHFEGGDLLQMYNTKPDTDMHQHVAGMIGVDRQTAKTLAFALLYGMGLQSLSERLGTSVDEARGIKAKYLKMLPGLRSVQKDIEARARSGQPIWTWGGRGYVPEQPKIIKGQLRSFEYKLLNYLIQGSSADCTKEAMCRLYEANLPGRMLVSVHDEIDWSVPRSALKETVREIDAIMRGIEFDVPMLSDTETGESWGKLSKHKL